MKLKNINVPDLVQNPVAIVEELCNVRPEDAEQALSLYVEEKGDVALTGVLNDMHPLALAKLIAKHDSTKSSFAYFLLNSRKIVDVLKFLPLIWYDDLRNSNNRMSQSQIDRIQEKAVDIFLNFFNSRSDADKKKEMLNAIIDDIDSFNYLLLPFMGYFRESAYIKNNIVYKIHTEDSGDIESIFQENFNELATEKEIIEEDDFLTLKEFHKNNHIFDQPQDGTPEHLFMIIVENNIDVAKRIADIVVNDFSGVKHDNSSMGQIIALYKNSKKQNAEAKPDDIYEML